MAVLPLSDVPPTLIATLYQLCQVTVMRYLCLLLYGEGRASIVLKLIRIIIMAYTLRWTSHYLEKQLRRQKLANVLQPKQSFTVSPIPLSGSASSPRSATSVPTLQLLGNPKEMEYTSSSRSLWMLNLLTDALLPPEALSAPVFDAALVHLLPTALHAQARKPTVRPRARRVFGTSSYC